MGRGKALSSMPGKMSSGPLIVARRAPRAEEEEEFDGARMDLKEVVAKDSGDRQRWLTTALKAAREDRIRLGLTALFDILAHRKFADNIAAKAGRRMRREILQHSDLFSAKQQKFLQSSHWSLDQFGGGSGGAGGPDRHDDIDEDVADRHEELSRKKAAVWDAEERAARRAAEPAGEPTIVSSANVELAKTEADRFLMAALGVPVPEPRVDAPPAAAAAAAPAGPEAAGGSAGAAASSSSSSSSSLTAWPRDIGAMVFGEAHAKERPDLGAVSPGYAGRFYQRALPAAQVPFASDKGRVIFREALLAGTMENYFVLAEQFRTQDEPTFCGLSTLAMVLNCLRIDPMRTWKGAWRWFNEQNLGCCTGPEQVREAGLSFDMFKCLASCNGADAVAHRAPDAGKFNGEEEAFTEAFRASVRATSRSQERECIVVCYSREALGQSGAGHFSPIGGYHEESDSVLILDVARFKYPPHWARLEDVVQGMMNVDPDTSRPRGWIYLRSLQSSAQQLSKPGDQILPLRMPYVPAAAGRRLSEALALALAEETAGCTGACGEVDTMTAMRRWLRAVCKAEPQVFGQLLRVANATALHEVLTRLGSFPLFRELCEAYESAVTSPGNGINADFFPPLQVLEPPYRGPWPVAAREADVEDLGLAACGELWVLLLLLLPQHLRGAVSETVAEPGLARDMARAVRGPWALPLEALRETLGQMLPAPEARRCSQSPRR
mmetsp:Transcript_177032/g.567798  ORF Transcript_177032/g.567798 Transcript_177032/m.567798 type:complete len:723 (-) Transcript_177032:242-2410(-)